MSNDVSQVPTFVGIIPANMAVVALRVLYLAVMMSWCRITESERPVPPTILRRCLSPKLVWNNGCRRGGCPMLSTSWGEEFGRRRRFAVDEVSRVGIGLRRRVGWSGSSPGFSEITWWRWTLTPRAVIRWVLSGVSRCRWR